MNTSQDASVSSPTASEGVVNLAMGMRRCFMTGKRCIFQPEHEPARDQQEIPDVFVIMPFRPHLDTFYEWSLEPFLRHQFSGHSSIRRADQVSRTGYVMCESICRHIQHAKLIVVDLSLANPNVYYELGLAVGLGRQLLLICDRDSERQREVCDWLGVPSHRILEYAGVSPLDVDTIKVGDKIQSIELAPLVSRMRIVTLMVCDPSEEKTPYKASNNDIAAGFSDTMEAATGVAVQSLMGRAARDGLPVNDTAVTHVLSGLSEEDRGQLVGGPHAPIGIREKGGKATPCKTLAKHVDSAFACVVDLADEDELAYFWLGYCHGRGINVIPVVRRGARHRDSTAAGTAQPEPAVRDGAGPDERPTVLAFDIRALWYMSYDERHPERLASSLQRVLRELILRDVPARQRAVFWERLTRTGRVHIFTGAFHHPTLNREVVGDWDLRAVSELVRYLSSTGESVVPELEQPVYAPETISAKISMDAGGDNGEGDSDSPEIPPPTALELHDRQVYIDLLKNELKEKNCLIVASAESNPYTEVVLAHAYGGVSSEAADEICFKEPLPPDARWTIALKGSGAASDGRPSPTGEQRRPRCFSRLQVEKWPEPGCRGFLIHANKEVEERYFSQDDAAERFRVLAHFLITYNPFSEDPKKHIIVVLNGVSGPATFAVAEALTGGKTDVTAAQAEQVLRKVNQIWDDRDRTFRGVEGFLRVTVTCRQQRNEGAISQAPAQSAITALSPAEHTTRTVHVERKFHDQRQVEEWEELLSEHLPHNPRRL